MIRYLHHSITNGTHVETGEIIYELSYWYRSDESPEYAGRRSSGYFNSYKEAEDHHNKLLVEWLLKDD